MIKMLDKLRLNSNNNSYRYIRGIIIAIPILIYSFYLRSGDLGSRDLWNDELWRALAIRDSNSYFDIPNGRFIVLSEYLLGKLGFLLLGVNDFALRIWPFLFSCCAVVVFLFICLELVSLPIALFSTFLFGFSTRFVEHAHEIKPYSLESFLFLSIVLLMLLVERKKLNPRWLLLLTTIVCVTTYTLVPFVIVAYFYGVYRNKERIKRSKKILIENLSYGVLIFLSCALTYFHFFSEVEKGGTVDFWAANMLTSYSEFLKVLAFSLPRRIYEYVIPKWMIFGSRGLAIILFFSCLTGPFYRVKKSRIPLIMTIVPFAVTFLLSCLGKYPIFTRVSAFYYTMLIINIGVLLAILADTNIFKKLKRNQFFARSSGTLFSALILYVVVSNPWSKHPGTRRNIQESRKLIAYLDDNGKKGDVLLLGGSMRDAISYYGMKSLRNFRVDSFYTPNPSFGGPERFYDHVKKLSIKYKDKTAWFVTAHSNTDYKNYKIAIRTIGGKIKESHEVEQGYLIKAKF